jgi:hypothetical protein
LPFAPREKCFRIDTCANVLTEHRNIFPQVQPGSQFCDCLLAFPNVVWSRRFQEPCCQPTLPHGSTRAAKKFEKRTFPKYVEILRIRVGGIAVPGAGFAPASPASVQACKAGLKVSHGAPMYL